jgi:hypothetical protein
MGMVINGKWVDDDAKYSNPDGGAFVRPQSVFSQWGVVGLAMGVLAKV